MKPVSAFLKNRFNFLLAAFVLLLFLINAYSLTYNFRPTPIHQWRQSDCLSIAKNYYEEGMDFLHPKIHGQGPDGGRTVSELPIINYSVAFLWKIFGEQEGIYRLFNYLIFLFAVFILFNTFMYEKISGLLSFFFTSLLLTSPLLVCYAYNFLADVPGLSMAIISFCLLLRFYRSKRLLFFYLSLLTATTAVLLKASAVVPLGLSLFFIAIDILHNRKIKAGILFTNKLIPAIAALLSLGICFLWYNYAHNYNIKNHSAVFLIGVLPIWEMEEKEIFLKLSGLLSDQFSAFLNRPMLFLFFMAVLYVFFNLKMIDPFYRNSFIISAIFFITYLILFFKVFDVHDYYLVNLMIFPVITFFCLGSILRQKEFSIKGNRWLMTSLVIIVFFNSFYSAAFYRIRTIRDDKMCFWYPFFTAEEKKYSDYISWRYKATMGQLATLKPELRTLGIKREEFFLSIPDDSPNSSLYLIDQKGYTVSKENFLSDTLWKSKSHFRDCSYFVLSDSALKASASFKNIAGNLEKILKHQEVEVYRIKKN